MAFKSNSSTDEVVGLRTVGGVFKVKMLPNGINPTVEEAQQFGIELKQNAGKEVNDKQVIEIYLRSVEKGEFEGITFKLSIFVSAVQSKFADGSPMYVDICGGSGKNTEYLKNPYRVAREGEDIILNMLRNWWNLKSSDEINPADLDFLSIAKANVKSIKDMCNPNNPDNALENVFKVLVGVKDGKYMEIFTKAFDREYSKANTVFTKALGWNTKWCENHWYPADLKPAYYTGVTVKPNDDEDFGEITKGNEADF